MILFRSLITVAIVLALAGCSSSVEKNEIFGEYIANHGMGMDKLTIYPDGKYTHEFEIKGQKEHFIHSGKWEWFSTSNGEMLSFSDFLSSINSPPALFPRELQPSFWRVDRRKGYWATEPERYFGDIRICFDVDLDLCFIKQGG